MATSLDELDDAYGNGFADGQRRVSALQAELAEARAQIAEWRGHHDRKDHRCFELAQQLEEARAQIAAKDAALREALHCVDDPDVYYIIEKALAAPAREKDT
jgi:chromosome segregation ATPase